MVSMVAFAENTERYVKTSPRARGQDRSCTLSALRCSKTRPHAALRETASQKCTQLRSCSRDPIGYAFYEYLLYRYTKNSPVQHVDPTGKNPLIALPFVVVGGLTLAESIAIGMGLSLEACLISPVEIASCRLWRTW